MDGIDFLLALQQRVQGPAGVAESALASLEQQIKKEGQALDKLETKLSEAEAALTKIQAGKIDSKAVEAFEKQKSVVGDLETKLQDAKEALDVIGQANVTPETIKTAEKQVEQLTASLEKARAKMAELESGTGSKVDIDEAKKAQAKVDAIKKEITAHEKQHDTLTAGLPKFKAAADAEKAAGANASDLAGVLQASGGPMAGYVGKAQSIASALGKAGVAGAAVLAAVVILAVMSAAIVAAGAFALFALKAADAARSARLLSDGAAGSAKGGEELEIVVSQLATKIPIARDRLREMAQALELAGFRGRDMQSVLTTMGIVASAVGDGAASKIQQIAESSRAARRFLLGAKDTYGEFAGLAGTGIKSADVYAALADHMKISLAQAKALLDSGRVSVKDGIEALEKAAQAKFGKTIAAQMASLTTQWDKFKEAIGGLFTGINLEKFLSALREVTSIFDQNTVTGQGLKKLFSSMFTTFFDAASAVLPYVRVAILGMVYAALLFYLHAKKIGKAISEAFGGDSKSSIDWMKVAFYAGVGAVGALIGVFLGLAAILAIVAVLGLLVFLPFILAAAVVAAVIYGVIVAVSAISDAFKAAYDYIASIDFGQVGTNLINGLVNGIKSGVGVVVDAVKALAGSVLSTITDALGIHSPSRVMQKYGQHTAKGFALGVDSGADEAGEAVEGLGSARPAGGGKRGKVASGPVNITINIYGAEIDSKLLARIREAVFDIFEQEAAGGATA